MQSINLGKTSHFCNLVVQLVHVHYLATYNRHPLYRRSKQKQNSMPVTQIFRNTLTIITQAELLTHFVHEICIVEQETHFVSLVCLFVQYRPSIYDATLSTLKNSPHTVAVGE